MSVKKKKNSKNTSLGIKWASRNKGEMAGMIEVSEKLPALWTGMQRSRAQLLMNNHAMGEKKKPINRRTGKSMLFVAINWIV